MFSDEDSGQGSGANIQSWFTMRNTFQGNGGHGIYIDHGPDAATSYLDFRAFCNLIVDNDGSGVCARHLDGDAGGQLNLTANTIAGNASYGVQVASSDDAARLSVVQNNIVWGNTYGSSVGWDPGDATTFTNNDWNGLFTESSCDPDGDENVDVDPSFENAANGDYHLGSGSCLIDKGANAPDGESGTNFEFDFEGNRRIINGQADIGADEMS